MIFKANQLIGFYAMEALIVRELGLTLVKFVFNSLNTKVTIT